MYELPDPMQDDGPFITGPEAWETLRSAVSAHETDNAANVVGARVSSGAGGTNINPINSVQRRQVRSFQIFGTRTMGGMYNGHIVYENMRNLTTTNATGPTLSFGTVNTNTTFCLCNASEFGSSWHFVSTNTFVQACRFPGVDATGGTAAQIWTFSAPMPKLLPVVLHNIGGTNGTAVASSTATFNRLTYTGSYNGQTLFSTQTAANVLVAGTVTPATSGWSNLVEGTNTYALWLAIEPVGGPVCAS